MVIYMLFICVCVHVLFVILFSFKYLLYSSTSTKDNHFTLFVKVIQKLLYGTALYNYVSYTVKRNFHDS